VIVAGPETVVFMDDHDRSAWSEDMAVHPRGRMTVDEASMPVFDQSRGHRIELSAPNVVLITTNRPDRTPDCRYRPAHP
jgi:hypothetical protein